MKLLWGTALIALFVIPSFAQDKNNKGKNQDDDVGPVAILNFIVVKDYNGKPVRNAAVILHEVGGKGQQEKGGLELKTDLDGKATYEGIPYGKFRVQVIATGFQTFGADYAVDQPTVDISIKMSRPAGQYSVYENHPQDKKDEQTKPQ
jgi:Carboxypeptidase regulatory-like domain